VKHSVENLMIEAVLAASDQVWARLAPILAQFATALDAGPDEGGWTARQVLSHIVGAWQRIPVHSAFFLTGQAEVPIVVGDSYWIPEWEHAPMEAFLLALRTAYEGNKSFIRQLDPSDLSRTCRTPFGVMSLGEFLITCYTFHIGDFHIPQLASFLTPSEGTLDGSAA
jgi:hypothetical protein